MYFPPLLQSFDDRRETRSREELAAIKDSCVRSNVISSALLAADYQLTGRARRALKREVADIVADALAFADASISQTQQKCLQMSGKPAVTTEKIFFREAIAQAIREEMTKDERIFIIGPGRRSVRRILSRV